MIGFRSLNDYRNTESVSRLKKTTRVIWRDECFDIAGGGKRRWNMTTRKKLAYVWQQGRFEGGMEFWQAKISQADSVQPVKEQKCLRM